METKKSLSIATMAIAALMITGSCSKNSNGYYNPNLLRQPLQVSHWVRARHWVLTLLTTRIIRCIFSRMMLVGRIAVQGVAQLYGLRLMWTISQSTKVGAGLNLADFGSVTAPAGTKQLTYKGWPLYTYAPPVNGVNTPEAAGSTSGEGFGGIWFVAKPDYTVVLANAQLVGLDGKNYTSTYTEGIGKTIYFTTASGITLYTFAKDSANLNKFTKSDFSNNSVFPIYDTSSIVVPSTLNKTDFATIQVFGKNQLTYKGWPLYNYGKDSTVRGSTKAVSFPVPGIWPVAVQNVPVAP